MKTFLISGVSALALAGMALAVPFEEADTNGDGQISFEELQAIDPATSEAEFTLYDVNLDGFLDEDEYAAWRVATQRDAEPAPLDEPLMTDEPLEDEFEMPEQDDADAYEPSLQKSLTKSDDHGDDAEDKDKDEERDGYGDGYGSDDDEGVFALLADEPPADDWSDEHDEDGSEDEESDDDAGEDEEDGGEERPW